MQKPTSRCFNVYMAPSKRIFILKTDRSQRQPKLPEPRLPVQPVANDRMSRVREMNPNLVGPACERPGFNQ